MEGSAARFHPPWLRREVLRSPWLLQWQPGPRGYRHYYSSVPDPPQKQSRQLKALATEGQDSHPGIHIQQLWRRHTKTRLHLTDICTKGRHFPRHPAACDLQSSARGASWATLHFSHGQRARGCCPGLAPPYFHLAQRLLAQSELQEPEQSMDTSGRAVCLDSIHSLTGYLLNPILPLLPTTKAHLWAREALLPSAPTAAGLSIFNIHQPFC